MEHVSAKPQQSLRVGLESDRVCFGETPSRDVINAQSTSVE
jgi:hypothetical protein